MTRFPSLLAPAALLAAVTSQATAQDAVTWLRENIGIETDVHLSEMWHPRGGQVHATDAITLWLTDGTPLTVPDAPARVMGLLERDQGRSAVMALVWSNAEVSCGESLANIGIDTGVMSYVTPANVAALNAYADPTAGTDHGTYAEQMDASVPTVPFVADLPDGTRFPVTGSGWGNGSYPVAGLYDASGNMTAIYTQFIAGSVDWIWAFAPPCADGTS